MKTLARALALLLIGFAASDASAAVATDVNKSTGRSTSSTTVAAPVFSTAAGNELLLAFVATDGPTSGTTTVNAVAGGGLTWTLVVRANAQPGTSEIWRAFALNPLTNVTVTATLSRSVAAAITVLSFTGVDQSGTNGSGAVGAVASKSAATGAQTASLVTTRASSPVLGVGNDWDGAAARTVGAGQSIVFQYLASVGDTYWVQKQDTPAPLPGTTVTINDTAPVNHRFNLAICEVLAAAGVTPTWTLSGSVTPAALGSGTTVTVGSQSAVADASGNFTVAGLANGSYTVTPTKAGVTFTPPSQSITVAGGNVTGVIFTAAASTWALSGSVTPAALGSGTTVTVGSQTTIADASGNFSVSGVTNGSYTVTPTKIGVTFTPASRTVTVAGGNVTGVSFTAAATTWSLSGSVTPAALGSGTTLTVGTKTAVADASGNFSVAGLIDGSYTVTPTKTGVTFTPPSRTVTVAGGNVTGVTFAAAASTWTLSGAVTPAAIGAGTTLTVGSQTAVANAGGNFSVAGLTDGSYTVTPTKSGVTFAPASLTVNVSGANVGGVSFTAVETNPTWTLSGAVTPAAMGSGATVTVGSKSAVVDGSGNFSIAGLADGSYTIAPTKAGVTFSPPSQTVDVAGGNVSGVNFAATAVTWTLSGTVTPAAIAMGATVSAGGHSGVVDATGVFNITGLVDGTYTVTAALTGVTFTPSSQSVTIAGANVGGVAFIAAASTWTISGAVTPALSGSGTTVSIGSRSAVADANGNFTIQNVADGSYTVTPTKGGVTFTPSSRAVTVAGANLTAVNFTAVDSSPSGQWGAPFDVGMVAVNMVMLHTGKVLMLAGSYLNSWVERVWDPATGAITLVPNPYYNLFCSGQAQLPDGRILVVGGYDPPSLGAANANIFDPVTQAWSAVPNMAFRRWYPTATALPDGRMLVTSGGQTCLSCLADLPEVFDPITGHFSTLTNARLAVPYYPFMFVLPDGTVMDGGANEQQVATSKLNVTAGTWSTVNPVVRDGHSAAMYLPGKILKTGSAADSGTSGNAGATAFVIDMNQPAPAWRQVASMKNARAFQNTTLLPDGSVLVTGGGTALDGYDVSKSVFAAELWSPTTETWQTLPSASIPRLYHSTALLLPDGRVLNAGSGDDGPAVNQTQAQIFSPPYLFKGSRPTITSAPDTLAYGAGFTIQTPDSATIASVALIRPGAVTHGFDEDQRYVPLTFTANGGTLTAQAPANANLAPPGYYMLFIVNTSGVPAVAKFVRFNAPGGDTTPPTAPTNLSGQGSIGSAALTWTAATDATGVALYNVHRSTTSGFTPTVANRVGQSTTTSFTDAVGATNTYYYLVTAQDVAGNIGLPSNEATVTVFGDTTAPAVGFTAPADQATVAGTTTISATASDDVHVVGVQFQLDGSALGAERTTSPYTLAWDSSTTSNGAHTLSAVARDAAGNRTTATITVTVANTSSTISGLVAAYGFNEDVGVQTHDSSSQSNTATLSNATWAANGKFGSALSFNGTNAWVTVADANSLDLTTGMTIEAWINPSVGTGWRTVVLKEGSGALAYSLYAANNASRPAGYVRTTTDVVVNGTAAIPLNVWTHVAITYDGTALRMYVNGVVVATTTGHGAGVTTGALRIGGNAVWGEYFKGLIDEVRIYNKALTGGEIQTDMGTPVP